MTRQKVAVDDNSSDPLYIEFPSHRTEQGLRGGTTQQKSDEISDFPGKKQN